MCTGLNVTVLEDSEYLAEVNNTCRKYSPSAPVTSAVGKLYDQSPPGI